MPKIITAHTGTPHITADDVGALLKVAIGNNDYLLSDTPETFTATLLDNNTLQLSDAEVVLQGTHIRIQATDKVTIEQGQNGMKRIDFVVCRYSKDDNGIESAEVAVVKGAPSASPSAPVVAQGDIRNGETLHEMPLFRVEIEGFTVTSIKNVCETVNSLYSALQSVLDLQTQTKKHTTSISKLSDTVNATKGTAEDNKTKLNTIYNNKLLWSGSYYMKDTHQITIPAISNQPNGIILVFSDYSDGKGNDWDFHSFVVHKHTVSKHNGSGHRFLMTTSLISLFCTKYLYISNTKISGHEYNTKKGTANSGVNYDNSRFVLRYVIGF